MSARESSKTTRSKKRTKSSRAGVIFPVGRMHRYLQERKDTRRVSALASVYLAAVVEYLVSNVFEHTVKVSIASGGKRIVPRHIQLAVRNNKPLDTLLAKVTIPGSGVNPHIHEALLRPVQRKRKIVDPEQKEDSAVLTVTTTTE